MKVLWLGQGGLLFVSGKKKVMVDPYLTNSLTTIDYTLDRRMKVNKKIFSVRPDVLILTNCHPDHADIETISRFAKKQKNKLTILSCENVFTDIADHEHCAKANNIMFEQGAEWSIEGFNIRAVKAKTDDKSAFGVIITDTITNEKYYVAGDTLYSREVLAELDDDLFAIFVPINGEYGSMNIIDAKRFALASGATYAVPVHFGMLDKIKPEIFDLENAVIPKIYRIIDFGSPEPLPNKKQIDRKFNEKPVKTAPASDNAADADGDATEEAEIINEHKTEVINENEAINELEAVDEIDVADDIEAVDDVEAIDEIEVIEETDALDEIEAVDDVEAIDEIEEGDEAEESDKAEYDKSLNPNEGKYEEYGDEQDYSFSFFDDEDDDEYDAQNLEFEPFTDKDLQSYAFENPPKEPVIMPELEEAEREYYADLYDTAPQDESKAKNELDTENEDEADGELDIESESEDDFVQDDYDFSFFDDDNEQKDDEPKEAEAEPEQPCAPKHTPRVSTDDDDDAEKIDAFVRELEKLERGETSDFDKI